MARQRRGGFKPPEIRGTLGTLLRTTIEQAGVVREVLERGAREGRARFDDARANRRRTDALAELGEIVLELVRRGEIDPAELPEIHDVLHVLDDLDDAPSDHAHDHHHDEPPIAPPPRSRFDDRRAPSETLPGSTRRRDRDDTVSSSRFSPPPAAAPARVWRPNVAQPADHAAPHDARTVAPPLRSKIMSPAPRKGGISFDDPDEDADLHEYMNPDDVPPKPTDP